MISRKLALCAGMALALASFPASAKNRQLERLLAMTPEAFESSAEVKDDRLETVAEVNTLKGFQWKQGLLGIVWDDLFLRGYVDKKTGLVTHQVYASLVWQGSGWPFFRQVNMALPSGTQSFELSRIASDVDCSGSRYGGCTYFEHVLFTLTDEQLRSIAATYLPGSPNGIAMRFKGQGGVDKDAVLMPSEVAGFLKVMDRVRQPYAGVMRTPSASEPAARNAASPPNPLSEAASAPVQATKPASPMPPATQPKAPQAVKPTVKRMTCRD